MSSITEIHSPIEEQYKKAADKCRSYSACSGCSTVVPHPSDFDECYKDPMACMEQQANGLFKMKERAMDTKTIKRLKNTIQKSKEVAKTIGEQEAIEFLADAEAYCNKPHTDINIINFCRQTLQGDIRPDIPNMDVQTATKFINARQRKINETLNVQNATKARQRKMRRHPNETFK